MKVTENDDQQFYEDRLNDIDGVCRVACWENKEIL